MLFKVALMFALGSLWMVLVRYQRESQDEAGLKREVEARLGALRDHLLKR